MRQTSNKKVKSAKRLIILAELLFMVTVSLLTAEVIQLKEVASDKIMLKETSIMREPEKFFGILIDYSVLTIAFFCLAVILLRSGKEKFSEYIKERIYKEQLKKKNELEAQIKASRELRLSIATLFGFKDIVAKDSAWEFLKLLLTQNFEELQENSANLTKVIAGNKNLLYWKFCTVKELNGKEKHQLAEFINSYSTLFELEELENYLFNNGVLPEFQKLVFAEAPEIVLPKVDTQELNEDNA